MILALESREIDIAIGLTEGFIAGLGKGQDWFRLVGTYVDTPLCWAISAGRSSNVKSVQDLKKGKLGISRIGSGSYVMGYVLANQEGWLDELAPGEEPFDFKVLHDFKRLRDGVNDGTADAFMWEVFTSKKFYDSGEIRQIGHIYTPWPSWHIVAHTDLSGDGRVSAFLDAVAEGVAYFNAHKDEAVKFISTSSLMEYSEEDAKAWLETVKFADEVKKVKLETVEKTIDILKKAGVIKGEVSGDKMVLKV